jgi:hypothetical protein
MMTEKITSEQENRIADFIRDAVRKLKLSKEEAQEIIKSGGTLQQEVKPILQKLAVLDQRFGPAIKEFEITVPMDYVHETQIDTYAQKVKGQKTTYYYNDAFTSKNFANATTKLVPGKKYMVKLFPILSQVQSEDCMAFLQKKNAILVGGQGLMLAHSLKGDEFPKDKYTISFDEKDALWKDAGGDHGVPYVYRYSDGDVRFDLGSFEKPWDGDYVLLCICDSSAETL